MKGKTYEIVNHVGRVVRSFTNRKKAMARAKRYAPEQGVYVRVDVIIPANALYRRPYQRNLVREYNA